MQDNELFELCKQVYEATGWKDTDRTFKRLMAMNGLKWKDWFIADYNNGVWNDVGEQSIPHYTSDYLLEKLPPALWLEVSGEGQQVGLLALNMQGNGEVISVYEIPYDKEFRGSYSNRADTPLKALLKLVIALDNAGQLKGDK